MTKKLRCAIYTRKSSEEGLEQDFNSLHAQREACEAYIRSQAGEGWVAMKAAYDDGGFSGGSMERPGLKRLLADIEAGKIDIVVVYKVDRITRSLNDFARIVDVFDRRSVSFVSVTQAFNTTSSMGRLTLNVLLSFAQFEREVTSERIRDKIAASKAKGMWMGGLPPLGYDGVEGSLVINPAEAALVRHIFERYLELSSARQLAFELAREGVRSKRWVTKAGKVLGDAVMNRGGVFHILQNRVYVGEVVHGERAYPGLHQPIVDRALFDAVQARLAEQAVVRSAKPTRAVSGPLAGKLFDADGHPMGPSFSYGRKGRLYRYYVPVPSTSGSERQRGDGAFLRVSAPALEAFLCAQISRFTGREVADTALLKALVRRVELRLDDTHLILDCGAAFPNEHPELALTAVRARLHDHEQAVLDGKIADLRVVLGRRLQFRGGRAFIRGAVDQGPTRANPALVRALKRSHAELVKLKASPGDPSRGWNEVAAPQTQHGQQVARLGLMSPELQRRILQGRQPAGLTVSAILKSPMPLAWADQPAWLDRIAN